MLFTLNMHSWVGPSGHQKEWCHACCYFWAFHERCSMTRDAKVRLLVSSVDFDQLREKCHALEYTLQEIGDNYRQSLCRMKRRCKTIAPSHHAMILCPLLSHMGYTNRTSEGRDHSAARLVSRLLHIKARNIDSTLHNALHPLQNLSVCCCWSCICASFSSPCPLPIRPRIMSMITLRCMILVRVPIFSVFHSTLTLIGS